MEKLSSDNFKGIVEGIKRFSKSSLIGSERNTQKRIVEPLLEILGWSFQRGEVFLEYPIKMGAKPSRVDYALQLEEKPVVLVETKAFDQDLTEDEARQAISYGKVEEIKAKTGKKHIPLIFLEDGSHVY